MSPRQDITAGMGGTSELDGPTDLAAALQRLQEALDNLDRLDDATLGIAALGFNASQERDTRGRFGSGGATTTADGKPIVHSAGTKDGLGRSKAAEQARRDSHGARAATEKAEAGGSHADAAKAHLDAAAQHREAAAKSVRADYKAAHEAAARAHEDVAKAHQGEEAGVAATSASTKSQAALRQLDHAKNGAADTVGAHHEAAKMLREAAAAHEAVAAAKRSIGSDRSAAAHEKLAADLRQKATEAATAKSDRGSDARALGVKAANAGKAALPYGGTWSVKAGEASKAANDSVSHLAAAEAHRTAGAMAKDHGERAIANMHAKAEAAHRQAAAPKPSDIAKATWEAGAPGSKFAGGATHATQVPAALPGAEAVDPHRQASWAATKAAETGKKVYVTSADGAHSGGFKLSTSIGKRDAKGGYSVVHPDGKIEHVNGGAKRGNDAPKATGPAGHEAAVRQALDKVTAAHPPGDLIPVREVRAVAGLPKKDFDKAALALSQKGEVSLHHHDFPSSLKPEEREHLIHDPTPTGDELFGKGGTHYVGIAKRRTGFARLALARAVEASAPGEPPTAFRILAAGVNETDKGPLNFTPRSAKLVMDAWKARGNPLVLYYEHEDRLPLEKRGGAPMKGAASAPSADLAIRGPADAPELWAEAVAWTDEAQRQIKTGERRQISPVAAYDEETREVLEILNVSLCSEGATHKGTLLLSKDSDRSNDNMDELYEALQSAIESGDWEEAENLIQKMEAADGGEQMAKMAKLAVKCAKDGAAPPPPPPAKPEAATKRLAASRDALARGGAVNVEAFDRALAEMTAAARRADEAARQSNRNTVLAILTRAKEEGLLGPDGDPVTEREHLAATDPAATERFVAHLRRSAKVGVLSLSKPGAETEVRPGGEKLKVKIEAMVTDADRLYVEQYNRSQRDEKGKITLEEYVANKAKHGGKSPVAGVA